MKKTTYFIAAIYQRLNDRDPDTPYLNVRMIIMINVIFHFTQFILWSENRLTKNGLSNSNTLFFSSLLLIAVVIFFVSGILFPRDRLVELKIKEKDKSTYFRIALGYFVLNFSFLMYLLIY